MADTQIPEIHASEFVTYVSTKGHKKVALVTGTPATVDEGTSLPTLSEGQLHLIVFSPSGAVGPRLNVPYIGSVEDNEDFNLTDEGGEVKKVGVWQLID